VLRHRDRDAVVTEQAPDAPVDIRAHIVDSVLRVGDPEAQFQVHAVVGKLDQARDRRGLVQYAPVAFHGAEQQLQGHFRIVA